MTIETHADDNRNHASWDGDVFASLNEARNNDRETIRVFHLVLVNSTDYRLCHYNWHDKEPFFSLGFVL